MMSAGPLSHLTGENPTTAKNNWLKVAKFADWGNGTDLRNDVNHDIIKYMTHVIYYDN
jgi:hypothetical protein